MISGYATTNANKTRIIVIPIFMNNILWIVNLFPSTRGILIIQTSKQTKNVKPLWQFVFLMPQKMF